MAAVFEEVILEWEGQEYRVTPTYRMIQRIEQDVSIAGISQRLAEGNPPMSHIASVVGVLLRAGGAQVEDEDVYAQMLTELGPGDITALAEVVVSAFVPRSKNSDSPGKSSEPGETGAA
jgi:hypothetical protein